MAEARWRRAVLARLSGVRNGAGVDFPWTPVGALFAEEADIQAKCDE